MRKVGWGTNRKPEAVIVSTRAAGACLSNTPLFIAAQNPIACKPSVCCGSNMHLQKPLRRK
jgi:hypothetical protein